MRDASGARLAVGGLLSALLHAAALTLAGMTPALWTRPTKAPSPTTERLPAVKLGEPNSRNISVNWLGFATPTRHETTEASPVDQPALAPTASPTASPTTLPNPSLADAAAAPASVPQPASAAASETTAKRNAPAAAAPVRIDETPAPLLQGPPAPLAAPSPAPAPSRDTAQSPRSTQPEAAPPTPASTAPGGEPAIPSKREADAFSQRKAPVVRLGRPVAAEGLSITTVRPRFSLYTRLIANPRDPLVEVQFDRHGRVRHARLLQSSGRDDVDRPVLDAIYQWKAKGEAIDALGAADSDAALLTVRFRIALR